LSEIQLAFAGFSSFVLVALAFQPALGHRLESQGYDGYYFFSSVVPTNWEQKLDLAYGRGFDGAGIFMKRSFSFREMESSIPREVWPVIFFHSDRRIPATKVRR